MLNSMRRAMTARCQNIGRGVFRSPHRRSISTALRSALWTIALVLLGVLAASCSDSPAMTAVPSLAPSANCPTATPYTVAPPYPEEDPALMTHLYPFEIESVKLGSFDGSGGAIESICEDLLVVTPKGKLALVFQDGTVEYLDGNVPMNYASLESISSSENPDFNLNPFRVADILLKEIEEGYTLFATHHYFTGECVRFRLSSTTLVREGQRLTVLPDWRTIFDAEPCLEQLSGWQNAGGKMLTDGEEHLLVTIGNHAYGQRPIPSDLHLGKLVRIEIETGESEIFATGIRNSQGLVRDAAGNIWVMDHGPKGGDELNLLREGADYGWPLASYGIGYGGVSLRLVEDEDTSRHNGFVRPAFSWIQSTGMTAIAVNDEEHLPLWKDDLLIVSLSAGSLFRVRRYGTDVQHVERIELGYRIRDIALMSDGRIALLRDGGWIYFLSRSTKYCNEEAREQRNVYAINCEFLAPSATPDSDTTAGAQLFGLHCAACHDLNAERHGAGPHLVGVIGRTAGEVGGFNFSDTLRSSDVVWTRDSVTRFLNDPQGFAPGTSMSLSGITEQEARAIADYIAGVAVTPDDTLLTVVGDGQPAIVRSDFDVYLIENTLIYAKEQCAVDDTEASFFLHIDPIDVDDLPDDRKQHGFDNLDFIFDQHGKIVDGDCVATVPLPDYDIAAIRTGQYVQTDDGFKNLWEGEINLDAAQPIQVDLARLVGNDAPAIRSDFDVYLIENRLIYAKEQCAVDDTAPTFFLHIDPINANDLPDDRKQNGFDNLDFGFEQNGEIVDGDCVATVPLPDYDIAAIRTGQYVQTDDGFDNLWEGEILFNAGE